MNSTKPLPMCPACRKGHLHTIERTETFRPRDTEVRVELLASRCESCGAETVRASQHNENLRRMAARKAQYGNLLMGEEIVALRKRYGLTQQAASKIFGKGLIAFSRYENEASYPDDSTTLLLTLAIEKPETLKWLADKAGVELPLWRERCEDEQRIKIRPIRLVETTSSVAPHPQRTVITRASSPLQQVRLNAWSAMFGTPTHIVAANQGSTQTPHTAEALAS
jgi:putative zinc finger/helix-turn-helix YgiT family protein